jgi:hypothetical protein
VTLAEHAEVVLRLARLKPEVREVLQRDGVIDLIGPEKIHGNVYRAVMAQTERPTERDDDQGSR